MARTYEVHHINPRVVVRLKAYILALITLVVLPLVVYWLPAFYSWATGWNVTAIKWLLGWLPSEIGGATVVKIYTADVATIPVFFIEAMIVAAFVIERVQVLSGSLLLGFWHFFIWLVTFQWLLAILPKRRKPVEVAKNGGPTVVAKAA